MVRIRRVRPEDVVATEETWHAAYSAMRAAHGMIPEPHTPEQIVWGQRRTDHLLTSDPDGSWLAEDGGRVIGMAQSQIRGTRWVLSNLGVLPAYQEMGIGKELLEKTLHYGQSRAGGAIFASPDPRAIHRYVRAGFDLHPSVGAVSPLRRTVEPPTGIQEAGDDALNHVDAVDSVLRGNTRRRDIEFQLSLGQRLLIDPDGGYAVVRGGRVAELAATDVDTAARLLRAHMARCNNDEIISVSWMRARDQWAIETLAEAGVALRAGGAVMIRGQWEMNGAYIPNGVFG
jgi:ribosomal protein S18 acetylase RimI-like enzyme